MANEINVQAILTIKMNDAPMAQASGAKDISQTNKRCAVNIQNIGFSSAEQLTYGDVGTLKYLFIKNMDATNYVQLALNDFTQIFAKLLPGEFCLFPVNQNTIYAKANTAAVDCCVCAADA